MYHSVLCLSSTFFRNFSNPLLFRTRSRLARTFTCYHIFKSLSSASSKFSLEEHRLAADANSFMLPHVFVLVKHFFRSFSAAWPFSLLPQCFPRSAQLIYQIPPRLSTTFFDFFHFLYLEDKCPQKRPLRPIGNRATLLSSLYHTMTGGGQILYAHQNPGPASGPCYLRK